MSTGVFQPVELPAELPEGLSTTAPARPKTPTKEEEAAAREKERLEQEALPYKWKQTIGDVDILIPVEKGTRGRECVVEIRKERVSVKVRGQVILEVSDAVFPLFLAMIGEECERGEMLTRAGPLPQTHRRLRINLDNRRPVPPLHPPREAQPSRMVAPRRHLRPQDRHHQDPAREQQAFGFGRRDEKHGREDDV